MFVSWEHISAVCMYMVCEKTFFMCLNVDMHVKYFYLTLQPL